MEAVLNSPVRTTIKDSCGEVGLRGRAPQGCGARAYRAILAAGLRGRPRHM